jgi:hypothetical protein
MSYPGDGKLPIIYVRGFGGGNIEGAVDDPFYGFSTGSVHVRADGCGNPQFYQFESPLLRLITDEHYEVPVHGDQVRYLEHADKGKVNAATVWIHRFYDDSAPSLRQNKPTDFSIEQAAISLFNLIRLVLAKTGAPKVFLVAHSMGGLICRSMLQRVIPEHEARGGDLDLKAGEKYVARLFTYATPHGGIKFDVGGGFLEWLRDTTRFQGSEIFGPDRMYEYLTPDALQEAHPQERFDGTKLPEGSFDPKKIFCLVGSNPEEYKAVLGLSSAAVGVKSDGLVQLDNAVVDGAHKAIVHRSHSGRYGIVNSEEGYQNLNRFLFGDLQVTLEMVGFAVGEKNVPEELEFQLDVGLAIRGLPVLVHEQTAAHHCPVLVERLKEADPIDSPRPLLTTFLSSRASRPRVRGAEVPYLRHSLKLRLMSIREEAVDRPDDVVSDEGLFEDDSDQKRILFDDHMEQTEDWTDTLTVDIEPPDEQRKLPIAWAVWSSDIPLTVRGWNHRDETPLEDLAPDEPGKWVGEIGVPKFSRQLLGDKARIRITASPRSVDSD